MWPCCHVRCRRALSFGIELSVSVCQCVCVSGQVTFSGLGGRGEGGGTMATTRNLQPSHEWTSQEGEKKGIHRELKSVGHFLQTDLGFSYLVTAQNLLRKFI